MIHLDTHVVAWLYAGLSERIPPGVRKKLESETLVISPMAVLELQYLFEIGRTREPARVVVKYLERRIGLEISAAPFCDVIGVAAEFGWTRDPFDRIIAATAKIDGAALLTADTEMLKHFPQAAWE